VQGRGANSPTILFHRKNSLFFANWVYEGQIKNRNMEQDDIWGRVKREKMKQTNFLSIL
jgi:hypothetical protein